MSNPPPPALIGLITEFMAQQARTAKMRVALEATSHALAELVSTGASEASIKKAEVALALAGGVLDRPVDELGWLHAVTARAISAAQQEQPWCTEVMRAAAAHLRGYGAVVGTIPMELIHQLERGRPAERSALDVAMLLGDEPAKLKGGCQ